ncbi:hypothetical protein DMENIID0001_094580 [Sergentomyia squamirostris]
MIATVARLRPGVPSTLNAFCTTDYPKGSSPRLQGFPNYQKNMLRASFYEGTLASFRKLNTTTSTQSAFPWTSKNYSSSYFNYYFDEREQHNYQLYSKVPKDDFTIISTYFSTIDDKCSRLFVVDNGVLHYSLITTYVVQDPAIIVFDLPSNACTNRNYPVLRRIVIPTHLYKIAAGWVYITLDYQPKGSCDDLFLYIANLFDYSLIVYDYKRGEFSPIVFADPSMEPVIAESDYNFSPELSWKYFLGIVNVVLGRQDKDGYRNAYYGPGSSFAEYSVSTKILKNFKKPYNPNDFHLLGYRGCNSQTYTQVIDRSLDVIYFTRINSYKGVSCWNMKEPINPDNIGVVFESEELHYISSMFLDQDGYLWFHTSHLPYMFLTVAPLNISDVNSKTFRVKSSEAIKGTICDKRT